MAGHKSRWGIFVFLLSPLLIGAAFALLARYPSGRYPSLYTGTLPILGMVLSGAALLAGHFSYPRVHNLKVYLVGYLTGLVGLAYFVLCRAPHRFPSLVTVVLLIASVNTLVVLSVPSFVKYRVARAFTLSVVTAEAFVLLALRFEPSAITWTAPLARHDFAHPTGWPAVVWLALVTGVSVWRVREEFHLGGLIAGVALVTALAWLSPVVAASSADLELLLFVAAPLYLDIGILIHWFSRMEHRISYDPLLHIYNRNYCSTVISEQSSLNTSPPLGVAMVDIDHFKNVNDSHGHEAGDQVLYAVAQTILREVVPDGVVCRYGGEEMVVFFPGKETREVVPIVEEVRVAVEELRVPARRKKLAVTVSIGVAHRSESGQSVIDVIHAADKALYRAKKGGRNQVKAGKAPAGAPKKK